MEEDTLPPRKPSKAADALTWARTHPHIIFPALAFVAGVVLGKWVF